MPAKVLIRCYPELKDLLEKEAEANDLIGGVNQLVVEILATHFKRADLARVPRQKRGRPAKAVTATSKAG